MFLCTENRMLSREHQPGSCTTVVEKLFQHKKPPQVQVSPEGAEHTSPAAPTLELSSPTRPQSAAEAEAGRVPRVRWWKLRSCIHRLGTRFVLIKPHLNFICFKVQVMNGQLACSYSVLVVYCSNVEISYSDMLDLPCHPYNLYLILLSLVLASIVCCVLCSYIQ